MIVALPGLFFYLFSDVTLVLSLFVPHLSFLGALGRLCFIAAFPGYLHLFLTEDISSRIHTYIILIP